MNLSETILSLYPNVEDPNRVKVLQSLTVPQIGDHHHEGAFMFFHLDRMVQEFEKVLAGVAHPCTDVVRDALVRSAKANPVRAKKFIVDHDLSKMDCMTLHWHDGMVEAVNWATWEALMGSPWESDLVPTVAQLQEVIRNHNITKVQYFRTSQGTTLNHGDVAAQWLRAHGETDDVLLHTIENHEITMSFSQLLVDVWNRHFGKLSKEAQEFNLLANYLDSASSLNKDLEPDMEGFKFMSQSYETALTLRMAEEKLNAVKGLDKTKVARFLSGAKATFHPVSEVDALVQDAVMKSTTLYDSKKLLGSLETLVTAGALTKEESTVVFNALMDPSEGQAAVGKLMGRRMATLRPVLDTAKVS